MSTTNTDISIFERVVEAKTNSGARYTPLTRKKPPKHNIKVGTAFDKINADKEINTYIMYAPNVYDIKLTVIGVLLLYYAIEDGNMKLIRKIQHANLIKTGSHYIKCLQKNKSTKNTNIGVNKHIKTMINTLSSSLGYRNGSMIKSCAYTYAHDLFEDGEIDENYFNSIIKRFKHDQMIESLDHREIFHHDIW